MKKWYVPFTIIDINRFMENVYCVSDLPSHHNPLAKVEEKVKTKVF